MRPAIDGGRKRWTSKAPAGSSTPRAGKVSATVADVWQAMAGEWQALTPDAGSLSCAVNAQYARMTTAVQDGDEIAFLPPVSGG